MSLLDLLSDSSSDEAETDDRDQQQHLAEEDNEQADNATHFNAYTTKQIDPLGASLSLQSEADDELNELAALLDADDEQTTVVRRNNATAPSSNGIRIRPSAGHAASGLASRPSAGLNLLDSTQHRPATASAAGVEALDEVSKLHVRGSLISAAELANAIRGNEVCKLRDLPSSLQACQQRGFVAALSAPAGQPSTVKPWITCGVLTQKSDVRRSGAGKKYCIVQLSDLAQHQVSCFVFGSAFPTAYKLDLGTLVYISQPNILPKESNNHHSNDKNSGIALSVSNGHQLLPIGQTTEFGYCQAFTNDHTQANGQAPTKSMNKCKNVINTSRGKFCDFHVKHEYKKSVSQRAGLNANASSAHLTFPMGATNMSGSSSYNVRGIGKGVNVDLQRQHIMQHGSVVAKPSAGMTRMLAATAGDSLYLKRLQQHVQAQGLEVSKPNSTINNLLAVAKQATVTATKAAVAAKNASSNRCPGCQQQNALGAKFCSNCGAKLPVIEYQIDRQTGSVLGNPNVLLLEQAAHRRPQTQKQALAELPAPKLGKHINGQSTVSLTGKPVTAHSSTQPHSKPLSFAERQRQEKQRAVEAQIAALGGINARDPNDTTTNTNHVRKVLQNKKRASSDAEAVGPEHAATEKDDPEAIIASKRRKLQAMLPNALDTAALATTKSLNAHLVKEDTSKRDALTAELERKEQMLDQMSAIRQQQTKAFYCVNCKTTSEALPLLCQRKQHTIEKIAATRRWFDCASCGFKQATLNNKQPQTTCSKCGKSQWRAAGMITQKLEKGDRHQLQVRGDQAAIVNLRSDYGNSSKVDLSVLDG